MLKGLIMDSLLVSLLHLATHFTLVLFPFCPLYDTMVFISPRPGLAPAVPTRSQAIKESETADGVGTEKRCDDHFCFKFCFRLTQNLRLLVHSYR